MAWNKMKLYIRRKILIGLIVSIAFILVLGLFSYVFFNNVMTATRQSAHSRRIQFHAAQVHSFIVEMETAQRGYGFTGDERFLDQYPHAIEQVNLHLAELVSLTQNQQQAQRVVQLKELTSQRISFANEMIALRKESFDKARDLILTMKGKKITEQINEVIGQIHQQENRLVTERSITTSQQFSQFVFAFVALIGCTLVLLIVLIYMINANARFRMLAEDKRRQAEQETKKINKELEAFSYSVSHDLRAPLRSINGYSQILKDEYGTVLDQEGNRVLGIIITNARRMGQLIDDLLAFSRLGRQELKKSSINMDEFIKPLLEEMAEYKKDRDVTVQVHSLGVCPADGSMIRQVWINLLSNAFKYTQKKDHAQIEVGASRSDTETIFYVKDNGVGFNMDYAHKLFGVFQRLHKTEEFEGTGVGLALVKQIVDRHDGRIWADAQPGQGATFYFSLPNT